MIRFPSGEIVRSLAPKFTNGESGVITNLLVGSVAGRVRTQIAMPETILSCATCGCRVHFDNHICNNPLCRLNGRRLRGSLLRKYCTGALKPGQFTLASIMIVTLVCAVLAAITHAFGPAGFALSLGDTDAEG